MKYIFVPSSPICCSRPTPIAARDGTEGSRRQAPRCPARRVPPPSQESPWAPNAGGASCRYLALAPLVWTSPVGSVGFLRSPWWTARAPVLCGAQDGPVVRVPRVAAAGLLLWLLFVFSVSVLLSSRSLSWTASSSGMFSSHWRYFSVRKKAFWNVWSCCASCAALVGCVSSSLPLWIKFLHHTWWWKSRRNSSTLSQSRNWQLLVVGSWRWRVLGLFAFVERDSQIQVLHLAIAWHDLDGQSFDVDSVIFWFSYAYSHVRQSCTVSMKGMM